MLLASGDAAGVGKRYAVVVHGALPYKLRMRLESTRVEDTPRQRRKRKRDGLPVRTTLECSPGTLHRRYGSRPVAYGSWRAARG